MEGHRLCRMRAVPPSREAQRMQRKVNEAAPVILCPSQRGSKPHVDACEGRIDLGRGVGEPDGDADAVARREVPAGDTEDRTASSGPRLSRCESEARTAMGRARGRCQRQRDEGSRTRCERETHGSPHTMPRPQSVRLRRGRQGAGGLDARARLRQSLYFHPRVRGTQSRWRFHPPSPLTGRPGPCGPPRAVSGAACPTPCRCVLADRSPPHVPILISRIRVGGTLPTFALSTSFSPSKECHLTATSSDEGSWRARVKRAAWEDDR